MKDMVICYASKEKDIKKCWTWKTYGHVGGNNDWRDDYKPNNTKSLPVVYNEFIESWKNEVDWIVLVHDDIKFPRGLDLCYILNRSNYDICGLAGSATCTPKEPALWHLMSNREDYRGAVSHPINETQHMVTSFGPMPSRVLVVDGLFIAIRTETLGDLRFDESNPGKWHHYDIDFCLTANKMKKKIGVIDYPVIHSSPGLLDINDPAFQKSQEWFLKKWS